MADQDKSTDDLILEQILVRSATDRDYRDLLLTDPDRGIEEVIGIPVAELPRPVKVRFMEKDAGVDAVFVLPDLLDPEGVLSDAELEAVAGGADWCVTSCSLTITICTQTYNNSGGTGIVINS